MDSTISQLVAACAITELQFQLYETFGGRLAMMGLAMCLCIEEATGTAVGAMMDSIVQVTEDVSAIETVLWASLGAMAAGAACAVLSTMKPAHIVTAFKRELLLRKELSLPGTVDYGNQSGSDTQTALHDMTDRVIDSVFNVPVAPP